MAALRDALQQGACVAVDRCNFDEAQRADFIAAAAEAGCAVCRLAFLASQFNCVPCLSAQVRFVLHVHRGQHGRSSNAGYSLHQAKPSSTFFKALAEGKKRLPCVPQLRLRADRRFGTVD